MEKLDKAKAIKILAEDGHAASYMANIIQSYDQFSDRKARLLKYAAHFVRSGFTVNLAAYAVEPCINYRQIGWDAFEVIGKAFYKEAINAEQVLEVVKSYSVGK